MTEYPWISVNCECGESYEFPNCNQLWPSTLSLELTKLTQLIFSARLRWHTMGNPTGVVAAASMSRMAEGQQDCSGALVTLSAGS